jgi:K+-sensing histidine kinase KdpD
MIQVILNSIEEYHLQINIQEEYDMLMNIHLFAMEVVLINLIENLLFFDEDHLKVYLNFTSIMQLN